MTRSRTRGRERGTDSEQAKAFEPSTSSRSMIMRMQTEVQTEPKKQKLADKGGQEKHGRGAQMSTGIREQSSDSCDLKQTLALVAAAAVAKGGEASVRAVQETKKTNMNQVSIITTHGP